jgi:hypothetical protein
MRGDRFGRLVRAVGRRPLAVLLAVGVVALAGAALALRLEPSAATDTLVNRSSQSFRDTDRFKRDFGDEAVVVLVEGDLRRTVLTDDLGRLLRLEGCLSGNVPARGLTQQLTLNRRDPSTGLPPVCKQIAELKPAKVVYGPGTFVNTAAGQIADEFGRRQRATTREASRAADAARRASAARGDPKSEQERLAKVARGAVESKFVQDTLALALRYGLTSIPSIDSADFVSQLVFRQDRAQSQGQVRLRERGAGPSRAVELAYASTGAAVLASGATAIAGFAALAFSDIKMLRDFGVVTVVDLTVFLLGVMLVLPAALLWAEEHGRFTLRDLDPRRWRPALGRHADTT